MKKAYDDLGLWGLAEEIKVLDPVYAPQPQASRLDTPVMVEHSIVLMAQIPPLMLESILNNTLVEKFKAGTILMKDWNMIPRSVKQPREPAIYLNYYSAPDGSGLTIQEYEEYIQAMNDAIQGNKISVNGIDIVAEVNRYYKARTNEKGSFLTVHKNSLRGNLSDLMKYQQRVVRAAKAQGCTEIRFPGEVGWAINTDSRVRVHHKLKGSADMFRLTMCVVSVLWPLKAFELTSFCLFRVVRWNHAEIVSLLSHTLIGPLCGKAQYFGLIGYIHRDVMDLGPSLSHLPTRNHFLQRLRLLTYISTGRVNWISSREWLCRLRRLQLYDCRHLCHFCYCWRR